MRFGGDEIRPRAAPALSRLIFAGFPVLRRAPLTMLGWGVCLLPLSVLSTLLSGLYAGVRGPWSDQLPPGLGWLETVLLLANLPVICASMAILAAAVFRAVADPDRTDGRWMRLGSDEIRLGLIWAMTIVSALVAIILVLLLAAAVSPGFRPNSSNAALIAGGLLAVVLLARFGLAPAMTVFEHRFAFGESWRMTRGRYGAAIVCALTFLIAYAAGEWLLSSLGDLLRFGVLEPQIGLGPWLPELARYATKPQHVGQDIARVIVGPVSGVIAYAPLAVLYRDVIGRNPADQAAVFD